MGDCCRSLEDGSVEIIGGELQGLTPILKFLAQIREECKMVAMSVSGAIGIDGEAE